MATYNIANATQADYDKFHGLIASGDYAGAGEMASAYGQNADSVTKYINDTWKGANTTADVVGQYMPNTSTETNPQNGLVGGNWTTNANGAPATYTPAATSTPTPEPTPVPKVPTTEAKTGFEFDPNADPSIYTKYANTKTASQLAAEAAKGGWTAENWSSVIKDGTGYDQLFDPNDPDGLTAQGEQYGKWTYDAATGKWVEPKKPVAPINTGSATGTFTAAPPPQATATMGAVNPETMTIEGRLQKLLNDNNPLVRQAGERAMAIFANRGLLNSSMASEAAMEAMIAKAIDIAGPDAATYFKQSNINQDWLNKFGMNQQDFEFKKKELEITHKNDLERLYATFTQQGLVLDKTQQQTLQTNYLAAQGAITSQFDARRQQIIMATDYPDEATRQTALQGLETERRNAMRLTDTMFEAMPTWQKAWSQVGEAANAEDAADDLAANFGWDKKPESLPNISTDNLIKLSQKYTDPSTPEFQAIKAELGVRD